MQTGNVGENVRFLLWRRDRDYHKDTSFAERYVERRQRWVSVLRSWLECDASRAARALELDDYAADEIGLIAKKNNIETDELVQGRMVEGSGGPIFHLNMSYLLDGLERGAQKQLCAAVGVDSSTISRWRHKTIPPKAKRESLARFFGLSSREDLMEYPVFLSLNPIGIRARREWLKRRIDEMPGERLLEFFPALRTLLEKK